MTYPRFPLLVTLFSRRFFENDLLAPDIDLRPSAIWLLSALATPSILWTVKSIVPFGLMVVYGYERVESASWADKSLLMMLAMVAAGIVTLLSWEALLVDRRDALVLGALPVRSSLVVGAKAVAVARLFAVVTAINLPSVLIFTVAVYSHWGAALMARALVAHLVAVTAASLSICLVLTAALVAVTSLFEGRWLRVMTVAVQAAVLALLTAIVFGIQWSPVLVRAARQSDQAALGLVGWWPPAWFVGLYQDVLGAPQGQAVFESLAPRATLAFSLGILIGIPLTLWLWRRALARLVSAPAEPVASRTWSIARRVPRWLTRSAVDRAYLQFFLTALWRSPRHRLAVLTAGGLSLAVTLEGALVLAARTGGTRWLSEFAVPVLTLLSLLAVLRWLLLLPAELPASWALRMSCPAPGPQIRRCVGRVLMLLAVAPVALLALALSLWQGPPISAIAHAAFVALLGAALVERAIIKVDFMPLATEYLPGRSNLRARWPIHVVVLLLVVPTLAQIERSLMVRPGRPLLVVLVSMAAAIAVAVARRRARTDLLSADPGTGEEWTPVQLRLAGI